MELVNTPFNELPISLFTEPWQDSDDFLWAATTPGAHDLVIHFANLFDDAGEAAFVCDLSGAEEVERNLACALVRHMAKYRQLRYQEYDTTAELTKNRADLAEAQSKLAGAQAELAKNQAHAIELQQENAVLKKAIFGASSEKQAASEDPAASNAPESEGTSRPAKAPAHLRSVKNAGRKPLPASLPRDSIEFDLPADKRCCSCCHGELHHVGVDVSEQLVVIPARYRVRRRVRQKYACLACGKIVCAEMPQSMIPGGTYSSAEFLAHIASSRFQFGLPYYRLETMFEQAGLNVTRTTLANAMITCAEKLSPLMAVLQGELLSQPIIHADETVMQVLREPDRAATSKSYLWLYRSCASATKQVVLFDYQETRAGQHASDFLAPEGGAFKGWLQVDGYSGYNKVPSITRVGCMAHVRRKFVNALEVLPSDSRERTEAARALQWIEKLYAIERKLADQPPKERRRVRQEASNPILDELGAWLQQMKANVLPKTLLGRAVTYAADQWAYVARYIDDGRLAIDNNIAEREIKQVVIGRKNWLFADSQQGANANAVFYSLVRTAVANGLNPYDYLVHVFERLPAMKTAAEVETLAPWNCRTLVDDDRLAA